MERRFWRNSVKAGRSLRRPWDESRGSSMPDWKNEIERRLAGLKLEPTREAAIVDEWVEHLEDRYDELVRQGEDADKARAVVLAELDASDLVPTDLGRRPSVEPIPVGTPTSGNVV